ncbi:hypothetical protein ACFWU5_10660 [Nocardia sp. NPDC058640]|uniref:hypothetical protein n=1 Tax=Nocardia sp. NPDC058640 TaxID=3346571 RepID=UPI0036558C6F
MSQSLTGQIVQILTSHPSRSAPQIAAHLSVDGVDRKAVNKVLYSRTDLFVVDTTTKPPRWSLVSAPPASQPEPPSAAPEMDEVSVQELTAQLTALGAVATGEELGDLIGMTEPDQIRAHLCEAAASGLLSFAAIGGESEDFLVVAAHTGDDTYTRERGAENIATWARSAADPISELPALMGALVGLAVPPHRLVQIAAYLRGTTPNGLL